MNNLPNCIDHERRLLGLSMLAARYVEVLRPALTAGDFFDGRHRQLWCRICEIYDRGESVELGTVFQCLQDHGEEKNVGIGYLSELIDGQPLVDDVSPFVKRISDAAWRRRGILTMQSLEARLSDTADSTDEVRESVQAAFSTLLDSGINGHRPFSTHDMIEREGISSLLGPQQHRGLKLPWALLDEKLSGIGPGQVILLMAATSKGKTSLALQVAAAAALQAKTPVIWTMEMNPRALFQRMVTQIGEVYANKRLMTFEEREHQRMALGTLDENPVYFDNFSRSVTGFASSLRQVRSRVPTLGIGVIDYLQQIRGARQNRAQEVSENSRAIKLMAMDLQIPMLVLSQVDRGSVKGEGQIGLHSAKESGDIENDADVVLWIDAGDLAWDHPTCVSIVVGKQREGPAGFKINMMFDPRTQKFEEYEE